MRRNIFLLFSWLFFCLILLAPKPVKAYDFRQECLDASPAPAGQAPFYFYVVDNGDGTGSFYYCGGDPYVEITESGSNWQIVSGSVQGPITLQAIGSGNRSYGEATFNLGGLSPSSFSLNITSAYRPHNSTATPRVLAQPCGTPSVTITPLGTANSQGLTPFQLSAAGCAGNVQAGQQVSLRISANVFSPGTSNTPSSIEPFEQMITMSTQQGVTGGAPNLDPDSHAFSMTPVPSTAFQFVEATSVTFDVVVNGATVATTRVTFPPNTIDNSCGEPSITFAGTNLCKWGYEGCAGPVTTGDIHFELQMNGAVVSTSQARPNSTTREFGIINQAYPSVGGACLTEDTALTISMVSNADNTVLASANVTIDGNQDGRNDTGRDDEEGSIQFDEFNPIKQFATADAAEELSTPGGIIGRALRFLFPVAGFILFVMIVWGGFEIISQAATKKSIDAGKQRITAAIIGFLLLFASYWIAQIIGVVFGVKII